MEFSSVEKDLPKPETLLIGPAKSLMRQGVKLLAAAGVVVYLWLRGDIAWEPLRASLGRWEHMLPAFLLLTLMPFLQVWRWQSLLRASFLHLPHREVFSLVMISKFFNMAFPGYLGGDILRGFYVSRRALEQGRGRRQKEDGDSGSSVVAASILFDRVAGGVSLVVFSLVGLLGSLQTPLPREVVVSLGLLSAAGLLAPLALFLLAYRRQQPPGLLARLACWPRLERFLSSFYQGAHRYARNLKLVRNILAVSFLSHGLAIASFILFGWALRIEIPLMSYLMLAPLGLLVTAIPVSPAGLGVGQVAFLALFHLAGTAQGANLFTLYMASHVVINLTGAVLYLFAPMGTEPRAAVSKE